MTPNNNDRPDAGVLLGAEAALLVVACCALLPLLVAGGAVAGIGGFLGSPSVIAAGVALLLLAGFVGVRRHRGGPGCCPPVPPIRNEPSTDAKDDEN